MFHVENLSKTRTTYNHINHLFSDGIKIDSHTGYFYPSTVFPNAIEIISAAFLHKKDKIEKTIEFYLADEVGHIEKLEKHKFIHPVDTLASIHTFLEPIKLRPAQPFYFAIEGHLEDSKLTISYRNI